MKMFKSLIFLVFTICLLALSNTTPTMAKDGTHSEHSTKIQGATKTNKVSGSVPNKKVQFFFSKMFFFNKAKGFSFPPLISFSFAEVHS